MNINEFTTKISGIPCICKVTAYSRGKKSTRLDEGDDSEFDCEILTTEGVRAVWLEQKLTFDDWFRLEEEWEATVLEHKHYINEKD